MVGEVRADYESEFAAMTQVAGLLGVGTAVWTRAREGHDVTGVIHHHDHGSQYTSLACTETLAAAGIKPSMGAGPPGFGAGRPRPGLRRP